MELEEKETLEKLIGSWGWPKFPTLRAINEDKIITLQVEAKESLYNCFLNPEETEQKIKEDLALQLAKKMLEEDLISIKTNDNIDLDEKTIQATIQIIQE